MFRNLIKTFSALTEFERLVALGASAILISSLLAYGILAFENTTSSHPQFGGSYREGKVGQPVFINPVLAVSDADNDLVNLVYSNLYDLSESVTLRDSKLVWTVRLKDNIRWHDGEKLTADDVVFTVEKIQDSESRSPLGTTWEGVVAERLSELEIKFTTGAPYVFFEDNLRRLNILPKHIFQDVPPANWRLSAFNLRPVGSGPYKYESHKQEKNGFISSYKIKRNENYFGERPYIENIEFLFFTNEDGALRAFNTARVNILSGIDVKRLSAIKRAHTVHELRLPNYYAIFLNQSTNPLFKNKKVRLALSYALPREEIIKRVFDSHAGVGTGPLPYTGIYTTNQATTAKYDPEEALTILKTSGLNTDKGGTFGKITLVVPNLPFLTATGEIIKQSWQKLGFEIDVLVLEPNLVNTEVIKTRNYEALLFGNALSRNPDILSFWHTNERFYPGLNLSLYSNKKVDTLLESMRQNFDEEERRSDLTSLQSLIIEDLPAIFLYSPNYIVITSTKVRGINELVVSNSSERFQNIENWYVKTKRVWNSEPSSYAQRTANGRKNLENLQPKETAATTTSEEISIN